MSSTIWQRKLSAIATLGLPLAFVAGSAATADEWSACEDNVVGNLVENCGFETGDLTGWTASPETITVDVLDERLRPEGDWGLRSHSGWYGLSMYSEQPAALTQEIEGTVKGALYELRFNVGGGFGCYFSTVVDPDGATGRDAPEQLLSVNYSGWDEWGSYQLLFRATGTSATLSFPFACDPSTAAGMNFSLDDVSVVMPTLTKDDCDNYGWLDYRFNNQGQCVKFVESILPRTGV